MTKTLSTIITKTATILLVMLLFVYSYEAFALADCSAVKSAMNKNSVEKAAQLVDNKQVHSLCAFYVAWAWQNNPEKARPYIERIKDSLNKREPFYYKALYLKLLLLDDLTKDEHRRAFNRLSNVEPKLAKKIKNQKLANPKTLIPLNKPKYTKPALKPQIEPLKIPSFSTQNTSLSNLSYPSITSQTQYKHTHELVFIYVHGLGGKNKETAFVHNLKTFIKENKLINIKIKHYSWNSPPIKLQIAPANYIDGKKKPNKKPNNLPKMSFKNRKTKTHPITSLDIVLAHTLLPNPSKNTPNLTTVNCKCYEVYFF